MPESPADFELCPDNSPPLDFLLLPKRGFCCPDCPEYKFERYAATPLQNSKGTAEEV